MSSAVRSVLLAGTLISLGFSASAGVILTDSFDPVSVPWTVESAGAVTWMYDLASCGLPANLTGGAGNAVCANSDASPGAFSTALISPVLDLSGAGAASLSYRAYYANYAGADTLDLDISTDGGSTWSNVLRWNEDHQGGDGSPGELVLVDLTPYLSSQTRLRWNYYDPSDGWDWYVQLDDILVTTGGADAEVPEPGAFGLLAAGLGALLLGRKTR